MYISHVRGIFYQVNLFLSSLAISTHINAPNNVMIFPTIYVSVTLFVIPTLYGNDDLCKLAFQDVGLDDAFDCNTTGLTNLTKESGKCINGRADIALVLYTIKDMEILS